MSSVLIKDAMVWDGSGKAAAPADVLVQGNRIKTIAWESGQLKADGATVVDAAGRTLMPGLVEGHAHLTFHEAQKNTDLGDIPPEEHTLITMHNAKTLLDAGFTSAFSAASAKIRLDVVIRNEINAGRIPGPRLRAAGPEITVTGGLGDDNRLHMPRDSFGIIADGVDEIARVTRLCIREDVDNIKLNISGDDFVLAAKGGMTVMREEEVQIACDVAKDFGKMVGAHARATESVKRAVRCGVDVIYHCDFCDDDGLDMLEAAKDRVFCAPAINLIHSTLYEASDWGIKEEDAADMGLRRVLESSMEAHSKMRERGIRIAIGGDYGFAWVPQGGNARDIEHFVNYFGFSSNEALQAATKVGGEMMGLDVGLVKEGYLADLLLVDGDPVKDVRILQDAACLAMIMQDGRFHKCPAGVNPQQQVA